MCIHVCATRVVLVAHKELKQATLLFLSPHSEFFFHRMIVSLWESAFSTHWTIHLWQVFYREIKLVTISESFSTVRLQLTTVWIWVRTDGSALIKTQLQKPCVRNFNKVLNPQRTRLFCTTVWPTQQGDFSHLNDKGLVLKAWRQSQHAHVGGLIDEVLDAVENSTTGGRDASVDSSLADGLSGHTCVGIDVLQINAKRIMGNMQRQLEMCYWDHWL